MQFQLQLAVQNIFVNRRYNCKMLNICKKSVNCKITNKIPIGILPIRHIKSSFFSKLYNKVFMIQNVTHCSGNIACLIPKYICTVPKHFVFVSIRKSHDCHTEHYNTEQTFFPRNSIKHSFFLKKVRFSKAKM